MSDPQSPLEPNDSAQLAREHIPSIPSPLNPEAASLRASNRTPKPSSLVREQREKKESLKKRESTAGNPARASTPDTKRKDPESVIPQRYIFTAPEAHAWNEPKYPEFDQTTALKVPNSDQFLRKIPEHAQNRHNYRYTPCTADPQFKHKQLYRTSEHQPYGPHMSLEDSDRNIHFDSSFSIIGHDKGWRMSRANVVAREGSLYYEVKIINGIPSSDEPPTVSSKPSEEESGPEKPQPHVRIGWARREAPLDVPVGFDAYSYAVTDVRFDTIHRSRPGKFIPPKSKSYKPPTQASSAATESSTLAPSSLQPIRVGDVIGLLITLPPLATHAKVVAGTYNPAVDFSPATAELLDDPHDIVRDRIPIIYKGSAYFESTDYQPTKPLEKYAERAPTLIITDRPNPHHETHALRTLPGSKIEVWRNGKRVGTAFDDLLAFLPPASAPRNIPGARDGLDDGLLGYYPAVSVFAGGMAELNFGPHFWCPPPELEGALAVQMAMKNDDNNDNMQMDWEKREDRDLMKPRGIWTRYSEQIAEDVVWDIIDEATFYVMDGGSNCTDESLFILPKANEIARG